MKRRKASLYGLAKKRGIEYADWKQERRLQFFRRTGIWLEKIPEPEGTKGEPPPALWKILDEVDDSTLKSCIRFDYSRPDSETLEAMLTDDTQIIGLDDIPDIVRWIVEAVPEEYRAIVADAYFGQNPIDQNIAQDIAAELWVIEELLPKRWRSKCQNARCIVSVKSV